MKIAFKLIIASTVFFIDSCSHNPVRSNSECVEFNNKGTESLLNYQKGNERELISAIQYLSKAIRCDSNYLLAYTNLATAYDYNKDYKLELKVYNKLLTLSDDNTSFLTQKGVVFEKLKQVDSAKNTYTLASNKLKKQLQMDPNNANVISDYLMLLALTKGKDSALKELDERTSNYPELKSKMSSEYNFYQNFYKPSYIHHLSQ